MSRLGTRLIRAAVIVALAVLSMSGLLAYAYCAGPSWSLEFMSLTQIDGDGNALPTDTADTGYIEQRAAWPDSADLYDGSTYGTIGTSVSCVDY